MECCDVDMTSRISYTQAELIEAIHRTAEIAPRAVVVRHVAVRRAGGSTEDGHGRHVLSPGFSLLCCGMDC